MLGSQKQTEKQTNEGLEVTQEDLLSQLSSIGVRAASLKRQELKLSCNISILDTLFDGGLPVGGLVEWGAPLGRCGRDVALAWLAGAAQNGGLSFHAGTHTRFSSDRSSAPAGGAPNWMLWVYGKPELTIYPPAWQARGVPMERMRFACSPAPIEDLRPVFLEPLFKIIVLDTPKTLTEDDCAFVARQARQNNQLVIVLRDFFLGARKGNVWSRIRLNCWFDSVARKYHLRVVRGLPPRHMIFSEQELLPAPVSGWQ